MSKQERSIDYVYDNEEKIIIDLNETIMSQKDGFEIRNQYNSNTIRFTCVECGQNLVCANSSKDKVYFRHLPQATYCVLSDSELLNPDNNLLEAYKISAICKESPRHKELKNKLGQLLIKEPGVVIGSIDIDSKFIFGNGGKRRPDVYCEYKGYKLAFEIQLSSLPLHYIKHRYDFYKNNGIYLIWIIDLKNMPTELSNFQRDIKYVWTHENLLSVDDNEDDKLVLECYFKEPFIYKNKVIHNRWNKIKISLDNLIFNVRDFFCFYYHFSFELGRKENELSHIKRNLELKEKEEIKLLKKTETKQKITSLLNRIREYKQTGKDFRDLWEEFEYLSREEKSLLNYSINWGKMKDGVPYLFYYIKNYKVMEESIGMNIVEFIISNPIFDYDINMLDQRGNGILYYLYNNEELTRKFLKLEQFIMLRKYKPTNKDLQFLIELFRSKGSGTYYRLTYYSLCDSISEMQRIYKAIDFLLFVESAKRMQRIGKDSSSWVQHMVFIINSNKNLWTYISYVLNNTALGEELMRKDVNGTINKMIIEHNLEHIEKKDTYFDLYVKIHPDLFSY